MEFDSSDRGGPAGAPEREAPEEAANAGLPDDDAAAFAQSIVDTVREGMLVLDEDFRVRAANHSFYGTFEIRPEETVGRLVYDLGNGQWDIPALRELLEDVLPDSHAFNDFLVEHDFEDIGPRRMLLNAHRLERSHLILLAIEDVTERKEAEEALRTSEAHLRTSEAHLRTIIESATEYAIVAMDLDRRVTLWNVGAERILGWTEAEITGQPADVFFTPEARAAGDPKREIETALAEGQAVNERWHVRKDGSRFWGSGLVMPLRDAAGQPIGFVKIFRDQTAEREHEEALRHANETLEARVEERTAQVRQMASTLAMAEQDERRRISQILHDDLQQLLFGIQLKMSFVRRSAEEAGAADLAGHIEESQNFLDRAIQVTRQLTVDLSPPVLVGEGLTNALEWLTTQMREVHGLGVEVLSGRPFVIPQEGMRVLLFQIVREFLFNVVKHAETDRAIVTLDEADGGTLIITVEDEGKGFDPGALQPKAEGGFGLFSVRERLRLFGGRLEIDSAPDRGTRVIATLPALLTPTE